MSGFVSKLRQLVLKGDMCSQYNSHYDKEVRKVWNARLYSKKPLVFVKVESKHEIFETIKFCKENKLPLCICNGGTSMFAQDDDAVVIKLDKMNTVTVDQDSKVVVVECGARQADVDSATAKYGLVTTLGQASFVGATGSSTLLGMGLIGRSYGYTIDNLIGIELITATGEITASAMQNEELFWAIKGFGPNFGVITKLHIKLHPMPPQIIAGNLTYAWENAANTLKNMRDFILERNDKRLAIYGVFSPHKQRGKMSIFLRFLFNGDLNMGRTHLEEFSKLSSPDSCDVKPTSYKEFQTTVDDLHPFGNYYYDDMGGFFLEKMPDEVIDVVVARYNSLPSVQQMAGSACYILPTGGAYNEIPDDSSPFMYRASRQSKIIFRIFSLVSEEENYFQQSKDFIRL